MTNDLFGLIEGRRAIKEFDNEAQITDSELDKILKYAQLTPTAYNTQPYRLLVVKDKEFRNSKEFDDAVFNQTAKTANSSALVIICGDKKAWQKEPSRYWQSADNDTQETMVSMINDFYKDSEQKQIDEVHRSAGMVGMNIMLMAENMGYQTCPMNGIDYDKLGKVINLPEDHLISFMVAIGKKSKDPFERPTLINRDEFVHYNKF